MLTDPRRVRSIKTSQTKGKTIIYWMSRDQRIDDNWALYYAYEIAKELTLDFRILFYITPDLLNTDERNFNFMMEGLIKVWDSAWKLGIPFDIIQGGFCQSFKKYINDHDVEKVVMDQSPLKIKKEWVADLSKIDVSIDEVDAHNLIPVWEASDKQEYAAYTIRKKIMNRINEFSKLPPKIDPSPKPIARPLLMLTNKPYDLPFRSGTDVAEKTLTHFLDNKLSRYKDGRNDPNQDLLSNLSPYIHFGQIFVGRILGELPTKIDSNVETFVEEVLVRRELSDNYCFYNENYDNFDGLPDWSKKSLNEHRADNREYIYKIDQFDSAKTHDDAWNAAQKEMLVTGKMHGYMRMYWAKKILEWSQTPEDAIETAIYLNDKYSIDGRDPNGYVGILWSIGGLHDRPWFEREVFGKVRYMAYSGLKRKFDVGKYIEGINIF